MFKSLDSVLERKNKEIQKLKNLNKTTKDLVIDFIHQNFSQAVEIFSIKLIKHEKGSLFIEFNNKAVAHEIKIKSNKLVVFLRDKGIKLNNLIIK